MTIPYSYFEASIPQMDVGQSILSAAQIAMPWGDVEAHTEITFQGPSDSELFERYRVRHQMDRDIDAIYNQETVKRIIENKEFHAFFNRKEGYLLAVTAKTLAREAMDRLHKKGDTRIAAKKPGVINLGALERMAIAKTTGGYFGKLKIKQVKSAALFGADVVSSDEWAKYDEAGELSALQMTVILENGETRSLILTRERVVVLYTGNEEGNLDFVASLHRSIEDELRKVEQHGPPPQ